MGNYRHQGKHGETLVTKEEVTSSTGSRGKRNSNAGVVPEIDRE